MTSSDAPVEPRCAGTARAWRSSTRRCCRTARRGSTLHGAGGHRGRDPPPRGPRRAADRHRGRLWPGDGGRTRSLDDARAGHAGAARRAPDGGQPRLGGRSRRGPPRRPAAPRRPRAEAERDRGRGGGGQRRRSPPTAPTCSPARGGSSRTATPARWRPAARARRSRVIRELARPRRRRVLACETRPLLQGARLTVWELARDGIPVDAGGRRRRRRADAPRRDRRRRSSAATASPPTATSPTRSAPTRTRWPRARPGSRSSSPARRRRSTRRCRERRRDRDRGARRRRGAAAPAASWSRCPTSPSATRHSTSPRPELISAFVCERGVAQPPTAAAIAALLAAE